MDSPQNNCTFSILIEQIHNEQKTPMISAVLLNKLIISFHNNITYIFRKIVVYI